jgi:hypothetical protein
MGLRTLAVAAPQAIRFVANPKDTSHVPDTPAAMAWLRQEQENLIAVVRHTADR